MRRAAGFRTEAISPIVNKTRQYLTLPLLRNILGQHCSAFALPTLMEHGTIVLANLAKGRLGEDIAALLGSLLMNQVELAVLSRAAIPAPINIWSNCQKICVVPSWAT